MFGKLPKKNRSSGDNFVVFQFGGEYDQFVCAFLFSNSAFYPKRPIYNFWIAFVSRKYCFNATVSIKLILFCSSVYWDYIVPGVYSIEFYLNVAGDISTKFLGEVYPEGFQHKQLSDSDGQQLLAAACGFFANYQQSHSNYLNNTRYRKNSSLQC